MVIRSLVIGLLLLAAACGDNPSLEEVCGNCPEGTAMDACVAAYEECESFPLARLRDECFAILGTPCDNLDQ